MRLNRRLQKTLALVAMGAISVTAIPVVTYALDYDTHWAKEAIDKWSNNGVLKGYEDGTFKPSDEVTRGELAAIIVRVFGLSNTTGAQKYTDVESAKWYASDVAKVSAAGIMNDYEDDTFRPEAPATREEAAYAIAQAYQVAATDQESDFTDQAQIADWAEDEIAALVAGGYLDGNPDGSFKPQGTLTRAEAVTMVDKITAELIHTTGTYTMDVEGNLVINAPNVKLENMTVNGNVYIAEGVAEGDVELKNVTITGDMIIEGGGVSTISMTGRSKVNHVTVDKAGKKPVRLLVALTSEVAGDITLKSTSTIEGQNHTFNRIIVDGAEEPRIAGEVTVKEVTLNTPAELVLDNGPTIDKLVVDATATGSKVRGTGTKGKIKSAVINANGFTFSKTVDVDKNKVTVGDKVTEAPTYPSGGGGGGGGNGGGTITDLPIDIEMIQVVRSTKENPNSGEYVDIPMPKNTINVVINEQAETVTINDISFGKEDIIIQAQAIEANGIGELNVALTGKLQTTLKPSQWYKVDEIKALAEDNRKAILETLEGFKSELTDSQYNRAVEMINEAIDGLVDYPSDCVLVEHILLKAEAFKNKLKDEDVQAVYTQLESALNTFGISFSGLGTDHVSVSGKLQVTATSKHEMDTITVNLQYK